MTVRITPFGGLGEVGLNSMLFDDGETAILVDAGLMFPDDTMLGIDFVIPDYGVLREAAPRLAALLLTHGHEDHIGAVPYLLRERADIPLIGSRLTLALLLVSSPSWAHPDVASLLCLISLGYWITLRMENISLTELKFPGSRRCNALTFGKAI